MSKDKEKLEEKAQMLECLAEAAADRIEEVLDGHVSALEKFCICTYEMRVLDQFGDIKFDSGVYDERMRVYNLWKRFHEELEIMVCSNKNFGKDLPGMMELSLSLGHSILGDVMYVPVALTGSEEKNPRDEEAESNEYIGSTLDSFLEEEGIEEIEEKVEEKAKSENFELMAKIVKLMSKAGTRSDGPSASWMDGEVKFGLQAVVPDVTEAEVSSALTVLVDRGLVFRSESGLHWLVDGYAQIAKGFLVGFEGDEIPLSQEAMLKQSLRGVLQSNVNSEGLMAWNLGALFYALRDEHPWVTREEIVRVAREASWCDEVGEEKFRFIGDVAKKNQAPSASIGVAKMADAIHELLLRGVTGTERIWKEYDIIGMLERADNFGVRTDKEHMTQENLTAALSFLVSEGKLEVVPVSPERPWIKQPGWRVKG